MTLDQAIEVVDHYCVLSHNAPLSQLNEAALLLIEAGKNISLRRNGMYFAVKHLLPGETKA